MNKKKNIFVKKPTFNVIGSLYDDLEALRDKYGFEQIVLHLGELARKTISRNVADRVWNVLNLSQMSIKNNDD